MKAKLANLQAKRAKVSLELGKKEQRLGKVLRFRSEDKLAKQLQKLKKDEKTLRAKVVLEAQNHRTTLPPLWVNKGGYHINDVECRWKCFKGYLRKKYGSLPKSLQGEDGVRPQYGYLDLHMAEFLFLENFKPSAEHSTPFLKLMHLHRQELFDEKFRFPTAK